MQTPLRDQLYLRRFGIVADSPYHCLLLTSPLYSNLYERQKIWEA